MELLILMLVVIVSVLLLRTKGKKYKSMSEMRESLRIGDRVLTADGICARVLELLDNGNLIVEVDKEIRIEIARWGVRRVIAENEDNIVELYYD